MMAWWQRRSRRATSSEDLARELRTYHDELGRARAAQASLDELLRDIARESDPEHVDDGAPESVRV